LLDAAGARLKLMHAVRGLRRCCRRIVEPEARDMLGERLGFGSETARSRGRLLDHRRILLGDAIHLRNRGIDLLQAGRLLLGRGRNVRHKPVDRVLAR